METIKPFGLYDSNTFPREGRQQTYTILPLQTFDKKDPYGHLANSVYVTMMFFATADAGRQGRSVTDTRHIVEIGHGGICIMGLLLELIPVLYERQFPNDKPTPKELGEIARKSYSTVLKFAGQPDQVSVPLMKIFFNRKNLIDYGGRIGILNNWRVTDEKVVSRFEIEETKTGRQLKIKDFEKTHKEIFEEAKSNPNFDPKKQCPAVEVKTSNGETVTRFIWNTMIDIAEKWHYVHTIENIKKKKS